MRALFVTGANGFIGSSLLRKLTPLPWEVIYCLNHHRLVPTTAHPKVHYVQAALDDSTTYAPYLAHCDTVLHLAAATGKAKANEFFEVNVAGTARLVEQSTRAGARNFIFISSIAVKFPDISTYPYAQSKLQAENIVAQSSLRYCIVRPTIVIGKNGATWNALSRIGRLPTPFVFGSGSNRIQPVFLDDLADCLIGLLAEDDLHNEIVEIGGPEVLTIEDFIKRIHFHYFKQHARVLHIPSRQLSILLRMFEKQFGKYLPLSAGQLSAFVNESISEPNRFLARYAPAMKTVDQLLWEVQQNA